MSEGFGGFKETPKNAQELVGYIHSPEKLREQDAETLPAFLGFKETPAMEVMRIRIIDAAQTRNMETFVTELNPYLIELDQMLVGIADDKERQFAEIGGMLAETYFYYKFGDQDRVNEIFVQAVEKAYGEGHHDLAQFIDQL